MDTPADPFLEALPELGSFADAADEARYRPLPGDWSLAVADVVASRAAIAAGGYKRVNMAAAAVITAVLNGCGRRDLPFTFGGDGAAVAVPAAAAETAARALAAAAAWIAADLGLTMRVALVPMAAIRDAGHDLLAARLRASDQASFALFAGGGSAWAEAQMKAGRFALPPAPPDARPDLSGLSCRWNPVRARRGRRIVSAIVLPAPGARPADFRALVAELVALTGGAGSSPLPAEGPVPVLAFSGVGAEARAAAPPGRRRLAAAAAAVVAVILARICWLTGWKPGGFDMRRYAADVAANSDFRKFDDGLKMTLDLHQDQIDRLRAHLAAAEAAGLCRHGLHLQDAALVTCLVPSPMTRDHIHFIDGADGGYAAAASAMKAATAKPA
jgi:hypothetical protein